MFNYSMSEYGSVREAFKAMHQKVFVQDAFGQAKEHKPGVMDGFEGQFAVSGLEMVDPYLHRPLANFYWSEQMPIRYGGGAVDFASFLRTNFYASDSAAFAQGGSGNMITQIDVQIEKIMTRVKAYSWKISIPWVDQMKLERISADKLTLLDEGVRMYYNQKLDDVAFFGFVKEGLDAPGLFNNDDLTATVATKTFDAMTPIEIFNMLNNAIYNQAKGVNFNRQYPANMVLVPFEVLNKLMQPMNIGTDANGTVYQNVLNYFMKNNFTVANGYAQDFRVLGNLYLSDIGTNNKGRIVIYRYDENVVRMPLPMDLTRGETLFSTTTMSTESAFICFIGAPQFIYPKLVAYVDNASA